MHSMCVDYANTIAFYYNGLEHVWALPFLVGGEGPGTILSGPHEITELYKMRSEEKVSS